MCKFFCKSKKRLSKRFFQSQHINAENGGADALWEELTVLSYALGEHPISVCDFY